MLANEQKHELIAADKAKREAQFVAWAYVLKSSRDRT